MENKINASLMRGITSEYHRALNAAFREAAKGKKLANFKPDDAKAEARHVVLGQVNAALAILDSGEAAA